MDLVKREEFDAVMEMAANARAANDALSSRLEALEARLAILEGGLPKSDAAKPAKAPAAAKKSK
jgi:BMFP domain-containing protein YqiC